LAQAGAAQAEQHLPSAQFALDDSAVGAQDTHWSTP